MLFLHEGFSSLGSFSCLKMSEGPFPVPLRSTGSDPEALPGLHPAVLHSQPVSVADAAPSDREL